MTSPSPTAPTDATIAQEQDWNHRQMLQPVTQPRFRVWTYAQPGIVLGCSQRKYLDGVLARRPQGVDVLQRPSGGGAVLTGPWMVSASVVLPLDHPWVQGRIPDSYQALGQLHVDVLGHLGVPCTALPAGDVAQANPRTGALVDWACYGSLAPWEVVDARTRKLVGLAQRRQRTGVLLVAGTLVTVPDWPLLCHALGFDGDAAAMARRTVACEQLTAHPPSAAQVAQNLGDALAHALGAAPAPSSE